MTDYTRNDGRTPRELRPVKMTAGFTRYAEGSVLVEMGQTRVLCNATIEERVPQFLKGKGQGWVTAEYAMLPRATETRTQRETRNGPSGRTQEIQRLIGRSLRSITDMTALGERTVTIDCDVIQADGGTRTAAITGAYVALVDAVASLRKRRAVTRDPIHGAIAAISVGIFGGQPVLDLDYAEDSTAETDMNLVINDAGAFVEIQGTAEGHAFRTDELTQMLALGQQGVAELIALQRAALEG